MVEDPILQQRARVSKWVSLAMRAGTALYLLATVLFFWAVFDRFTAGLSRAITLCLVAGSFILAPAMVTKYAVKAADRADREGSW